MVTSTIMYTSCELEQALIKISYVTLAAATLVSRSSVLEEVKKVKIA